MDRKAQQPEDFAGAFEAAFARLQVRLEMACAAGGAWPERAAGAIRQGLEFAATDPDAAGMLTSAALAHGVDGVARYERLMAYLASLLEGGRAESPHGADLPPSTERSLAGGVATVVANRVDRGRAAELSALHAELLQFVLTPYLGTGDASRRRVEQLREQAPYPDEGHVLLRGAPLERLGESAREDRQPGAAGARQRVALVEQLLRGGLRPLAK